MEVIYEYSCLRLIGGKVIQLDNIDREEFIALQNWSILDEISARNEIVELTDRAWSMIMTMTRTTQPFTYTERKKFYKLKRERRIKTNMASINYYMHNSGLTSSKRSWEHIWLTE